MAKNVCPLMARINRESIDMVSVASLYILAGNELFMFRLWRLSVLNIDCGAAKASLIGVR